MNAKTTTSTQPKTDEEYRAEAQRLLGEARLMLEETKRIGVRSRRLGESNRRSLEQLKEMICGSK